MRSRVEVAFPKNDHFLKLLPQPDINRLAKSGWKLPRTVFLDSFFMFTFFPFLPARAGSWIIDIQSRCVFFRTVAFRRGYVSQAPRIELRDTVLHEEDHLEENEAKGIGGSLPNEVNSLEELNDVRSHETRERETTADELSRKFGREKVQKELIRAEQAEAREFQRRPAVHSVVAEAWLGSYLASRVDALQSLAIELPSAMRGGNWEASWRDTIRNANDLNRYFAGHDLPSTCNPLR